MERGAGLWSSLDLARKFLLLAALPVGANSLLIGDWVVGNVSDRAVQAEGATTALYVDAYIEPLLRELAQQDDLSVQTREKLDERAKAPDFARRFPIIKIWNTRETIVYSTNPALVGATFQPTAGHKRALAGRVEAELGELEGIEHSFERQFGKPLLELSIPVFQAQSSRVIAVVELYESADQLQNELRYLRIKTWLIVAGLSLAMLGVLFTIVWRGSRTIVEQQEMLTSRIETRPIYAIDVARDAVYQRQGAGAM